MDYGLGANLKRLRKDRKLYQVDVAVAVDIDRTTLSGIETGKADPGRETLKRLADFYGVTLDELYSGALPADAPHLGERVKDPDEAALLRFWRTLDEAQKRLFLIALARGGKS